MVPIKTTKSLGWNDYMEFCIHMYIYIYIISYIYMYIVKYYIQLRTVVPLFRVSLCQLIPPGNAVILHLAPIFPWVSAEHFCHDRPLEPSTAVACMHVVILYTCPTTYIPLTPTTARWMSEFGRKRIYIYIYSLYKQQLKGIAGSPHVPREDHHWSYSYRAELCDLPIFTQKMNWVELRSGKSYAPMLYIRWSTQKSFRSL